MWLPKLMMKFMSQVLQRCIGSFHLFSLLCQRRSSCWKYLKWGSYFENRYHHAKMVEKKTINFSVSRYCTLLFSRKGNIKFSVVVLVAVYCNILILYLMIAWRFRPWITLKYKGIFTCFWKTAIKTLNSTEVY